jgi:fatty acid desaturase
MSEVFYLLWQGGLLVFWFWMGSFVAGNEGATEQWKYEWLNRVTRFLAVPALALFLALTFGSSVDDESILNAPNLSRSEYEETKRRHQAVWLVRGFAGFCGAFWRLGISKSKR